MKTTLNIVNQHLKFNKVQLIAPSESAYLHIAAEIDHSPFPFFLWESTKKKAVLSAAKNWCAQLQKTNGIINAAVFKACVIPPGKGKLLRERQESALSARYDIALLIEATSPELIGQLRSSSECRQLMEIIGKSATKVHCMSATNIRHIGPVNHLRQGVFLFNYFYADDLRQNLGIWEYTAGWFQEETHLDNSTVLLPMHPEESRYSIVNHCRWDNLRSILPSLLFKRSFRSYVLDNFYANNVAAMPVLYRLA